MSDIEKIKLLVKQIRNLFLVKGYEQIIVETKKAITKYSIIKVYEKRNIPKISLIEFELKTGRTHQIRVHMIYKGTSILGDQKYRKKNMKFRKLDKTFLKRKLLISKLFELLDN